MSHLEGGFHAPDYTMHKQAEVELTKLIRKQFSNSDV